MADSLILISRDQNSKFLRYDQSCKAHMGWEMRRTLKDPPVVHFKPYLLFVLNLHKFLRTWKDTRKSSRFPGDALLSWNDKASLQSNL